MDYNNLIDEINKNYETKLILGDVWFFKNENELDINFLTDDEYNPNAIDMFIKDFFKEFNINIKNYIYSKEDLIGFLEEIFSDFKYEIKNDIFEIKVRSDSQIDFYKNNDNFNRIIKAIEKLGYNVKYNSSLDIDEDKLREIEEIREKKVNEEISNIIRKNNESKEKNIKKIDLKDAFTYGRFSNNPKFTTDISDLVENPNKVLIRGKVFSIDKTKIKNSTIVKFDIDDGNSAIRAKLFVKDKDIDDFNENFIEGMAAEVCGVYSQDAYDKILCLNVSSIQETSLPEKLDLEEEKRIEFNIHSKYSNLESIVDLTELFKRLKSFGHTSVGITDLFNVQAYPEIYSIAKKNDIKLNLGLQTNIVEDYPSLFTNYNDKKADFNKYVVFDIETTGLSNFRDKIIEIGAVKIENNKIIDIYQRFVNPKEPLSDFTTELTGITNQMVSSEKEIDEILPEFLEFSKGSILVAHNAEFDVGFIKSKSNELGLSFDPVYMDTMFISRAINPKFKNHKLDTLTKNYQVSLLNHHRASDDAKATAEVFIKMLQQIEDMGVEINEDINKISTEMPVSNNKEFQNIIFAKNKIGLKNLYILVSKSNLDYFYREPRIPLNFLEKHREGLLIGSGNYKSKLFYLTALEYDDYILEKEIQKFDFIGLVPLDFSTHLINRGYIKDEDHLKSINKKIYRLAKKNNKLCIAIGDVYYLDKKDYPFRNILKNYPRKKSLENSGAFYLKNTNEMLAQFEYFEENDKRDIVIYNTHKLDELIENFSPIADGTFPPKIKDAENILTEDSYKVARSIYGEELPEIVETRLKKELDSIISNGYATLYIIAKKLVHKSNEDGYLVGSRGSVGSSFAATMAEITEVNPLPPHYVCEKCKHSEFIFSDEYSTGIDLPDKLCPNCNEYMKKDGYDIPFETFLGFNGDKEPDIDLNFASVYQSKIHKYTESLFGKTKVFRAGTLGTIAEATAKGMARRFKEFYPDDENIKLDHANLNRISRKIVGVKRTTGQHAGGLIIVPENKDIEDFTPVQYPADKKETGIITTHFDYHAIDKNLLKLDLLGHNAPTIIRLLTDMSGVNAVKIDLSDRDTMSIFSSTEKLNIKHDYTNIEEGSLGIPEFGTKFVRGMLEQTKPTTFDELIRISGLSHGTDVWRGNAEELIKQGITDLKNAICTRDDIMNYLIEKGLKPKLSFDIMEQVRKGKGLKPEQIEEMKNHEVPNWYIDSCLKIQYMFPKAHAVAYVMMSYRIAYFKVHLPSYFYAVTFTNEISNFKYSNVQKGLEYLTLYMQQLRNQEDFTVDDVYLVYELVEEMYARDIKFTDIDLYKSHPTNFEVVDESTIRPPLMAIENVSESMASKIYEERTISSFISKEDFQKRTKINKTAIKSIEDAGLFDDMQETNQIDFFSV